jgi:formylglycine-generating enzyme required for sulfatase activity
LERWLGAELGPGQQVRVLDLNDWQKRADADAQVKRPPPAAAPFDFVQAKRHQENWAKSLQLPVEYENSIGMKLRLIPPGEFLMGAPEDDVMASPHEKPQHKVRLSRPFYAGVYEVTRGQFAAFVAATSYQTDAERKPGGIPGFGDKGQAAQDPRFNWRAPSFAQDDRHPVVDVSWNDAQAFCGWLSEKERKNYRLATVAEWEYACRAGTTTLFPNGDDWTKLVEIANMLSEEYLETILKSDPRRLREPARDGYAVTAPIGSFLPNAFGLYDMAGNVWEWCQGFHEDSHTSELTTDPTGPETGTLRANRGGAFECPPRCLRPSGSNAIDPSGAYPNLGFRVICLLKDSIVP